MYSIPKDGRQSRRQPIVTDTATGQIQAHFIKRREALSMTTTRDTARNGESAGYIPFGYQPWDNDDEREFFIDHFVAAIHSGDGSTMAWEGAENSMLNFRRFSAILATSDTPVYSIPIWTEQAACNTMLHRYVETQLRNFTRSGVVRLFYKCSMAGPWVSYGDVVLDNGL